LWAVLFVSIDLQRLAAKDLSRPTFRLVAGQGAQLIIGLKKSNMKMVSKCDPRSKENFYRRILDN